MLSKEILKCWFRSAAKRLYQLELVDFICDIVAVLFYQIVACKGAWYFLTVIIIVDVFRFFVRGAWYYADFHNTAHYWNPSKDINAIICSCFKCVAILLLLALRIPELLLGYMPTLIFYTRSWLWYAITMATIIETFRCLLHTIHKYDKNWLGGTRGHIGIPNWISITRLAISIVMPHIYITQSLGKNSNIIATILMIATIGTDGIDGFIARKTHSITKCGKYLDPLGDKLIFFPNAVAFIWLFYQNSLIIGSKKIMFVTIFFMAIAVTRDVLFFVWFFTMGRRIPSGIGASLVDKIRMAGICSWLLSTAIALSMPASPICTFMTVISIMAIISVAILSIISIHVDYQRLQQALNDS